MKFYGAVIILSALQCGNAFTVKAPQSFAGNTELSMSSPNFFASQTIPTTTTKSGMTGVEGMMNGVYPGINDQKTSSMDVRSNVGSGSSLNQTTKKVAGGKQKTVWEAEEPVDVQGGSLRTWSFMSSPFDRVQVLMGTEGRPLNANVELWQGPDNTPVKMGIYVEDGSTHPFSATLETPRSGNTVAIRNTGNLEFPLTAAVEPDNGKPVVQRFNSRKQTIQGGALKTYPFDHNVQSVQILLTTNGRPLNCRIELLQGPNNDKQVMEVYTEDGMERPFYVLLATPGTGNVIRIVNTAPVEFPLSATIEPYSIQ